MAQNSKGTRVNSEKCPSHACLSAAKSKVVSEAHGFYMDCCRDILRTNSALCYFPKPCLHTNNHTISRFFFNLAKYLADCSLTVQ